MDLKDELKRICGGNFSLFEDMSKHTTLKIGGKADLYAAPSSLKTFSELLALCRKRRIKYAVIGKGSNLLVSDDGFRGMVISTENLNRIYASGETIKAMAGATLSDLIEYSVKNDLTGLENLAGIPATVGGATVMNAGAFGGGIGEKILFVEVLKNGRLKRIYNKECRFLYRGSRFVGKNDVIVSITLKLTYDCEKRVKERAEEYKKRRAAAFPKGRSCGSVFKNPAGVSAGKLIDEAGLKGYRVGGAKVSESHANFIINDGNALAFEVSELINIIKDAVYKNSGVKLCEEVIRLGNFNDTYGGLSHAYDLQSREGERFR